MYIMNWWKEKYLVSRKPKCIHALGAVLRSDGRLRPITDCSRPVISVNDCMESTAHKFKFARLEDTKPLLSYMGYGCVIDISNAYRSINIYPPHRQYMGFTWEMDGKTMYYCDNTLCFGVKSAPYIFNCVSDFVARALKRLGVDCVNYLDDYFVAGNSFEECALRQQQLIHLLRYIGFKLNFNKVTSPCRNPKYLGVIIDLVNMCFRLPEHKLHKTTMAVGSMLNKKQASRKSIERLTGLLAHCATLVWGG